MPKFRIKGTESVTVTTEIENVIDAINEAWARKIFEKRLLRRQGNAVVRIESCTEEGKDGPAQGSLVAGGDRSA